jgi:hypothetical protein
MNIAELIGRHIKLSRRGKLLWGLCPFHNDRHPSFAVYPDHYHCFSCGEHGDAIDWLRKKEGMSFTEAQKKVGGNWLPTVPKDNRSEVRENINWPVRGVQWQETAFLRERLAQSHWSSDRVKFTIWASAPALSDEQLRLRHPYAQGYVLERLRKVYPKP